MANDKLLIGFDFSINKPACTVKFPDGDIIFAAWPIELNKSCARAYSDIAMATKYQVDVAPRNWEPMKNFKDSSAITLEHTKRSLSLARLIINWIDDIIVSKNLRDVDIYMASEGLSFGSSGNSTLDLATYRGVLLAEFYNRFSDKIKGFYTFAPITLKSTAGCATKEKRSSKDCMIEAFKEWSAHNMPDNHLYKMLIDESMPMKNSKGQWITCVDDLVDSFWAMQTIVVKECI